jgi:hypothetical protein
MNLTNRIKKIEEKVSTNNPEPGFCPCYKKHFESLGESVYNKDPDVKIEVYPCPDLQKPICDICNKRISKDDVEMAETIKLFYGYPLDE